MRIFNVFMFFEFVTIQPGYFFEKLQKRLAIFQKNRIFWPSNDCSPLTKSDYIAKVAALEAENADLRFQLLRIQLLESENTALKQQVLDQTQKLAELTLKVEQLSVRKNSSNSSVPPSTDLARKNRSLRTVSGRRPGAQPGHKGTTLEMTGNPEHTEKLVPSFCSICANALDASRAELVERRQVVDIPPIHVETTEYQVFGIACHCGHHQVASFPMGVDNHIQYGPNIVALATYHNVYQYVPFKRLQDFFIHVCHLPLSVGTLENMVSRMAEKARPIWDGFRQSLEQSKNVGGDETGAKVNGKKQWIWVWQTTLITFIAISVSRGAGIINALFPKGFPLGTFCSDRWKAQLNTLAKKHQMCLAHLLRELEFLIQTEKTSWADQFKELLLKAIKLKQALPAYPTDHPGTLEIEKQMDDLLKETVPDSAAKTKTLQKSMGRYRAFIFPFLYDPDTPFENNASERAIRNVKVKLKVSGQFKTGQQDYCIIRSIIDTAIKNRQPVFKVLAAMALMPKPDKAAA
jgi:transposase